MNSSTRTLTRRRYGIQFIESGDCTLRLCDTHTHTHISSYCLGSEEPYIKRIRSITLSLRHRVQVVGPIALIPSVTFLTSATSIHRQPIIITVPPNSRRPDIRQVREMITPSSFTKSDRCAVDTTGRSFALKSTRPAWSDCRFHRARVDGPGGDKCWTTATEESVMPCNGSVKVTRGMRNHQEELTDT